MRAIDKLLAATDNSLKRRVIELPNGEEFEFWLTPLTAASRERALRKAGGAETGEQLQKLGLELVALRCVDENGQRLFTPADMINLRNQVGTELVDKLFAAVGGTEGDEEDVAVAGSKSTTGAVSKRAKG